MKKYIIETLRRWLELDTLDLDPIEKRLGELSKSVADLQDRSLPSFYEVVKDGSTAEYILGSLSALEKHLDVKCKWYYPKESDGLILPRSHRQWICEPNKLVSKKKK